MWHLFQDIENTSGYIHVIYFGSAMIISYACSFFLCKRKSIEDKNIIILSALAGVLLAALTSIIYFSFATVTLFSILGAWLFFRKMT